MKHSHKIRKKSEKNRNGGQYCVVLFQGPVLVSKKGNLSDCNERIPGKLRKYCKK